MKVSDKENAKMPYPFEKFQPNANFLRTFIEL